MVFHEEKLSDGRDYVEVFGLLGKEARHSLAAPRLRHRPSLVVAYKLAVPAANGSGSTTDFFGVALNSPTVLGPGVAVTGTFLTIGSFDTEAEAEALLKYVKSKFARAMLGILKVTQHNAAHTWRHVPNQDFTSASDMDWSKDIPGSTPSSMPSTGSTPRRSPSSRRKSSRWSSRRSTT